MHMDYPLIEYLRDKIYLGAFDNTPRDSSRYVYFTFEDSLLYNPFHHDFGPLSAGHLYRFAIMLHEVLNRHPSKAIVLYSSTDEKARANAACVLCCYMVLIQKWPPHLALAPISQVQPPLMPFRDAGYSEADFTIAVQDVVYGVWRAKEHGLLDLKSEFNIDQYEYFEMVENGDLNDIGPNFVAFASPRHRNVEDEPDGTFSQVLDYFEENNVQLVVRLNSHLYPADCFVQRGVKHIDLIFEDGTCPSMLYVQAFIGAAECVIKNDASARIAVHCRAGLGRTGCLIGAYLIYKYGFTAQEVIGYMRFLRPGMVVGPQQHWLYLHQNEFREWRYTMAVSARPEADLAGFCPLVTKEKASQEQVPRTPERKVLATVNNTHSALPAPTPGQPRKSPVQPTPLSVQKVRSASRYASRENSGIVLPKRTATDFTVAQQRELARQIRTTSNPSPRQKRMPTPHAPIPVAK